MPLTLTDVLNGGATFVVALGGGGLGAWLIARTTTFGDRFINHRFDERIERLKSSLQGEITQLQARLSHFTDRGVRSNQLEYDAVSTAWTKIEEAYSATNVCIARFYEHPDFNTMTAEQLERYFEASKMSVDAREYIVAAADKNVAWARTEDLRLINLASTAIREVHIALSAKGIFIPKELEDEFRKVLDMCSSGWAHRKGEFSYGTSDRSAQAAVDFFEKLPKAMEDLKAKVRARILAPYPDH